ncbi:hypothetical protein [Blastococcus sp. PRF04-17]|uniref:hypothetical protein n=1 Tax=Blastococcus sp. PRF04-17 TaxID=2933797 RepID=UPI001FF1B64D|nr:hypothetical protein [Blastococcus sp. PRF04-17]UOY03701.1 hypothetical protein MVA48_10380 [Blastococcus sp. PRF04-17]
MTSPKLVNAEELSLVRSTVLRRSPQRISEASNQFDGLADYAGYLRQSGVVLHATTKPSVFFKDEYVMAYEMELTRRVERTEITAGTQRTLLSRNLALARDLKVTGIQVVRGGHTSRTAVGEPMADADVASWEIVADAQTRLVRLHLKALIYGARGAGMDSADFKETRGVHVHRRRDGAVVVEIQGERSRLVVVLDRYGDRLLALARELGDELLIGRWPHRESPVSDLLLAVRGGTGLPRPLPRSMRRAYVAELLSTDVSVVVLVRQLGRHSLTEIQNALPYAQTEHLDAGPLRRGVLAGAPRQIHPGRASD